MIMGMLQPLNAALRPSPTAANRVYWHVLLQL
jgi:hypothetical protein